MKNTVSCILGRFNSSISKAPISLLFALFIVCNASLAETIQQVSAGWEHTVALKSDGTVWTWGANKFGQLGDGTTIAKSLPVQVEGLSGVVTIDGGEGHTLAVKLDGTVWAWGLNNYGQLGDATTENKNIPVQVNGLLDIIAVACGGNHSVVLDRNGDVWAWGANEYGQLGIGGESSLGSKRNKPEKVNGLSGIIALACGGSHTIALSKDGEIYGWGCNQKGQIGDGTYIKKTAPVKVNGLSGIIAITSGGALGGDTNSHNLALKSDGTVWAWGSNSDGQLGDGTDIDRNIPVQVGGLSHIIAIAGGGAHSVALKSDGTVWAWGCNWAGQLGIGIPFSSKNKPVQVKYLSNIITIASGWMHSIAEKSDGTLYAWGYNELGELGDGTFTNRSLPVPVKLPLLETDADLKSVNSTDKNIPKGTAKINHEVASDALYPDMIAPVVNITTPPSGKEYLSTSSTISLGGSAEDNESGVKSATWSDDLGRSGVADGTTSWTISGIDLPPGSITITVTAMDDTGNIGSTGINIAHGMVPTVMTVSASNITSDSVTLGGKINACGLSTTAWFEYGTESGQYDNTTPPQNLEGTAESVISAGIMALLQGKTYYYRAAARNNAGTTYGAEMSFDILDTTAPVGSIAIKGSGTYTNSATVIINLAASDNIGVTGYYISMSKDASLAIAGRWIPVPSAVNYSANISYALSGEDGTKTVYVWFRDDSWNISEAVSDDIVLDTTAPSMPDNNIDKSAGAQKTTETVLEHKKINNVMGSVTTSLVVVGENSVAAKVISKEEASPDLVVSEVNKKNKNIGPPESVKEHVGNKGKKESESDHIKDTDPPDGFITINNDEEYTDSRSVTVNLSATDNVGIVGYYISMDTATPSSFNPGWKYITSTPRLKKDVSYILSGKSGAKIIYAWYKDFTGNVSKATSDDIILNITPPVGSLTVNKGSKVTHSKNVVVNLAATDDVAITAYYISLDATVPTSTDPGWKTITPTTYFTGDIPYNLSGDVGYKTIYVWYRDVTGMVSSVSSGGIILDMKTTKK